MVRRGSYISVVHATDIDPAVFRRRLLAWGRDNRRSFPWRETNDPFRVLVAEVLLQRSRGRTVAVVFSDLLDRWPDASSLASARVTSIEAVIRPLGLVGRASKLRELARSVARSGSVPDTVEGLLALPGVGPYAAGATMAAAYGRPAPVVDGVTARVYRRYFGLALDLPPSTDRRLWDAVKATTPRRAAREWNWAVLDLAATICLPKRPRCSECPLASDCHWARAYA